MSYVFMKVLESAPERYERGMRLLTLGRLGRVRQDIAAMLRPGDRVLDIGCGTGVLVVMLARKGAQVTGIDVALPMLRHAANQVRDEGLNELVELKEMGAVDLDTAFRDEGFDAVVSTLVFSELSEDEIKYTLDECCRILRPGGRLLIADEVLPDSKLGQATTYLLRLPFAVAAFVLTQNTTHRIAGLGELVAGAGFQILDAKDYLAGTLRLFIAERAA